MLKTNGIAFGRKVVRSGLIVLLFLAIFVFLLSCQIEVGANSAIVVLVDYSRTFAPLLEEDRVAIERMGSAIVKLANERLARPLKIYWATIGTDSFRSPQPCGASMMYSPTLTKIRGTDPKSVLDSSTAFIKWTRTCSDAVVRLSANNVQTYTDISGALALAAENTSGVSGERILIVISDFLEDFPPSTKPREFKLQGHHLILLWRPGTDDQLNPFLIQRRLAEWRTRLHNAGASTVCARPIRGFAESDLAGCLAESPR